MKVIKLASILFVMIYSLHIASQSVIDHLFDEYSGSEGFTTVHVTNKMFSLFADLSGEGSDPELGEALSGIDEIRILSSDDESPLPNMKSQLKKIHNHIESSKYEELMIVKSDGEDIKFLIMEEDGLINEFLMLVDSLDNFTLISITGNIDLKKISQLSGGLGIDGMEQLDALGK